MTCCLPFRIPWGLCILNCSDGDSCCVTYRPSFYRLRNNGSAVVGFGWWQASLLGAQRSRQKNGPPKRAAYGLPNQTNKSRVPAQQGLSLLGLWTGLAMVRPIAFSLCLRLGEVLPVLRGPVRFYPEQW